MNIPKIDRRTLLSGAALAAAAPLVAGTAAAQAPPASPPSPPPGPTREERISAAAAESRMRLDFDGTAFSGPGYDWLLAKGRAAHFFLLGEEHGIAENPKLAAQLFAALVPSGYSKVAIEISPPMAAQIDRALASGGIEALKRLFADPGSNVAFFGMREEAEWLAAARRAVPGRAPVFWGNDYDIAADRRLIAILKSKPKPAAAATALAAIEQASAASWAKYAETRDLTAIFGFSGDPALARALRSAWPKADAEARGIVDTIEETLEINGLWSARKRWESNERRSANLRSNFLRHWRSEKAAGRTPRVFLKFGASHLMRGRNSSEVFDLGTLVPEIAAIEGKSAFHLLVLPGAGTEIAALDPTSFTYKPHKVDGGYMRGLGPILGQALPDAFTMFDTHRLRPLLGFSQTPADPELMRMVHGFDAILVMSGSTASANL